MVTNSQIVPQNDFASFYFFFKSLFSKSSNLILKYFPLLLLLVSFLNSFFQNLTIIVIVSISL